MKAQVAATSPDASGTREASRRFRVIAELGEGGMARVHLAMARGPSGVNKLVVLKSLRSHMANDPACLEMFLHEARLAARLNHPNVVQTYEVTEDAGRQVMVMEYLEGQPLSQVFARARKTQAVPTEMYVHVLCDTLAGLHYAHELTDFDGTKLNLVHRDVSPQNVFVTFDGQVKILDFGIAKAAVNATNETETGVLKGKLRYMAPEQIAGDPLDRRADLFAVGAILWEVLADERIWAGVSDMTVMQRVTSGDIPSPRGVNPNVPEVLDAICMKAMSMDPAKRFATAEEFQIALEEALGKLGFSFKQRDLGARVSELFADHRSQIRTVIEAQTARVEGLSSTQMESFLPVALHGPVTTQTPSQGRSETLTVADSRSRWRSLALVTGGVALASAFFIWQGAHRTTPTAPPAAASAAPAPPPPESPKPTAQARVTVAIAPSQARAFFDGQELPANPYSGTYDQDRSKHQVRAEAPGYVSQTVDVVLDHDTSVSIALERERPAARPLRTEHGAPTRPASTASSAAPKTCAEPYFVDDKGIKRIRPECF
jgi:serine/threonine-protein kinase